MKINTNNIKELIKNKDKFLQLSSLIKYKFNGPSFYFYNKVIERINKNKTRNRYKKLLNDIQFFEYLYATLACWSMHRTDTNTRMVEFEEFKNSIIKHKKKLILLCTKKLKSAKFYKLKKILLQIFNNLKVMQGERKLVAHSKLMHFLLPNLIPPIDKGNVIEFFYGIKDIPIELEFKIFFSLLIQYQKITKKLRLTDNNLNNEWNASIPKLIDNAIIGFNLLKKNVIIGLGNPLLTDEGIGIKVLNELKTFNLPFTLIDGGTDGYGLIPLIEDKKWVILVDAISGNNKEGDIITLELVKQGKILINNLEKFEKNDKIYSLHNITLIDVINLAKELNKLPKNMVLFGMQVSNIELGDTLSKGIIKNIPNLVNSIIDYINKEM